MISISMAALASVSLSSWILSDSFWRRSRPWISPVEPIMFLVVTGVLFSVLNPTAPRRSAAVKFVFVRIELKKFVLMRDVLLKLAPARYWLLKSHASRLLSLRFMLPRFWVM